MPNKNVALVLSSGGSKGLAHIGVINELERQGFNITSISGSSIGAVIGGLYAMNKLTEYMDWVKTLDKRKVWGLMDFTLSKNGFLKGERVFNEMQSFIPDMLIEEMRIPFSAVATDIINEKEVVFNSGSFYSAIRASIAIPTAIKPIEYKDTYLVDGGVLCPTPIEHIHRNEGDILVVVNLYGDKIEKTSAKEINQKPSIFGNSKYKEYLSNLIGNLITSDGNKNSLGYFSLLDITSSAMIHKLSKLTIQQYQPEITINIPSNSAKTFDFHKANELIKLGKNLAKKQIENYNQTFSNTCN
ncbi:NTE family protein [Mesonia phycicola]|uniref:NTE family protein n=1 Tax=Mesonia phycicola TaxID=579105 RepID=A0A1M6H061_9FLAO|nr:patatin-like phospholipase family protein [Mesonia phycicola]SHJ15542.1 NTE family protein [Mesonia phycicola]